MVKKEFVKMKLGDLIPYENNPRKNEDAVPDVAESIRQCGDLDPIEVDEDNVILSGHTRLLALRRQGFTETDVIRYTGLTEDQKKKYRLLANKTGEKALWDPEKLEKELADLDFEGFDFGFDDEDLEGDEEEPAAEDDNYEPEPPEEPKSKRGDIYSLGRHRLMCGDSTSVTDVEALCGGRQMDLLITDPPYNVDYEGGTGMKIQNDNMEDEQFRQFLRDAFLTADTVMKPGATFYIWHADSEGYNFRGACHDIQWKVRQCLIWAKNALVMGRQDYQWKHEPCLYGWKDGASHNWYNDRSQTTVLEFDRPTRSKEHPTMKPVPLFDYQIKNSSRKGDAVLDLFGGSGTTMVACEQDGRDAFLMEIDPKYTDVIVDRYIQLTGKPENVLLIRDGKNIPYSEIQ